jgi:Domain of unknown function (DUF4129)
MSRRIAIWLVLALAVMGTIAPVNASQNSGASVGDRRAGIRLPSPGETVALQIWPSPGAEKFGDKDEIGRELESIRDQPEFRRLRKKKKAAEATPESEFKWPQWIKDFFNWLGDLFRGVGNVFSGLGVLLQSLAYAILAAVAAAVIWLLVRAFQNYQGKLKSPFGKRNLPEEGEAEIPPGDIPADEYLKRASELAERGLFREAIGQLILGAMSRTERSGLIRFRRGLTHRDYLRALRSRAMPHQSFKQIVSVYEPICFGRRPANMDHYLTSLDGYKTGFFEPLAEAVAPAKKLPANLSAAPQLS